MLLSMGGVSPFAALLLGELLAQDAAEGHGHAQGQAGHRGGVLHREAAARVVAGGVQAGNRVVVFVKDGLVLVFCSVRLDKTHGRLSRETPPLVGQTARARCFQDVQRRQGLGGLGLSYPGPLLRIPRQVAAPAAPGRLPREPLDAGQPELPPPAGRHPAAARNAVCAGGGLPSPREQCMRAWRAVGAQVNDTPT